jgi:TolB-like protein/DNA-binding SARP family transcriptional activator
MLSLRLFGGLSLSGPDGPIGGRATQRRRLALLSVLAVARTKSVSRDKIVALFWPEADSERARHLLADSLYVLRESLGDEAIVATGDDLSIDGQRLRSDTMDFDDAIDAGDASRAVAIYAAGGDFMDGVHLADAPEFERWVDEMRSRFIDRYRRAVEELANASSKAGDRAKAVEWWRMLAAHDRLSSRVALRLMRALADAGDQAGALEFAQVHEAIVRAELEAPPDPSVSAFAAELRVARAPVRVAAATAPTSPPRSAVVATSAVTAAEPAPHGAAPLRASRPRRAIWFVAPAVLLLATATWGATHLRGRHDDSIAVLPFDTMSGDATDASFAAGMTEELIASLARIDGLRVIASTSTLAFKGHHTDVRSIADTLHVAYVLEGGWQRVGSRIRVNVRLVDGIDGATRWSETYNRDARDAFDVQDDIGRAVAAALRIKLLGAAGRTERLVRHHTTNVAAYDWYVRGMDQQFYRTNSGTRIALSYFQHAVDEDSNFAAGYAGLARTYNVISKNGDREYPAGTAHDLAKAAARQAIALDDSLVDGHVTLAYTAIQTLDMSLAASEARKALALDPHDLFAHMAMAQVYCWMDRHADQVTETRLALDADPLSPSARAEYAQALYFAGRFDEAQTALNALRDLRPPLRRFAAYRTEIFIAKKSWPEALAASAGPSPDRQPIVMALRGYALAGSGDRRGAERMIADLSTGAANSFEVATVYVGLGDDDQAFAWLNRSVDDQTLRDDLMGPIFARLRSDPRFNQLRQRIGLQKL